MSSFTVPSVQVMIAVELQASNDKADILSDSGVPGDGVSKAPGAWRVHCVAAPWERPRSETVGRRMTRENPARAVPGTKPGAASSHRGTQSR